MSTIGQLYRRVQQLNTDKVIDDVFIANQEFLAEENKKQLHEGFDRTGARLKRYKNAAYARKKYAQNPIPGYGNPDFFLTGAFFRQWQVRIDGDVIRNILNDPKSQFLLDRDPNILGLGGDYRKEALNKIRPEIITAIRQKIKL